MQQKFPTALSWPNEGPKLGETLCLFARAAHYFCQSCPLFPAIWMEIMMSTQHIPYSLVIPARVVGIFVLMAIGVAVSIDTKAESVEQHRLIREKMAGDDTRELSASRVSFPPHTVLPWHWHSGEEIFFVIEGSITLKRRGQIDVVSRVGEARSIAPGVIHAGQTGSEGAELVIFRVHAAGEPERYLAD